MKDGEYILQNEKVINQQLRQTIELQAQRIQSLENRNDQLLREREADDEVRNKLGIQIRDQCKELGSLEEEAQGYVDTCNNLIDELNLKCVQVEELSSENEALKSELEQAKKKLASKKRDYHDY